eukprot:symbB.v1.2.003716.t1/scaffold209.1/size267950/14
MSTAGYATGGQSYDDGMINLDVQTLTGEVEELTLRVERSTLGSEVRKMVLEKLPVKLGAKLVLDHTRKQTSEQGVEEAVTVRLKLHQTLQEQGLAEAEEAILSLTYVPTQLHAAWCFLKGLQTCETELSLEGITQMTTRSPLCLFRPPRSLISLTFTGESFPLGVNFQQRLARLNLHLPKSLQSLTFGREFNQSLDGVNLPDRLQNLVFGYFFNQSLESVNLPSSLQNLSFGSHFDQSLEGVNLPDSLQSLSFGNRFNQSLEGVNLPDNLQSLSFGDSFNQSLDRVNLPDSLQNLSFGYFFNQSLEGVNLPDSLQGLKFGDSFNQSLEGVNLPDSLQSLSLRCSEGFDSTNLPESLRRLSFCDSFNQSLEGVNLPDHLQSLTFGYFFNQSLDGSTNLPESLQSLSFSDSFNQSLEGVNLPDSLQSLSLGYFFNQSLDGVNLPERLQSLSFGDSFNQSLDRVNLPGSLQNLSFGNRFNQSLDRVNLPDRLQSLSFGNRFNQSLDRVNLPDSLQNLSFGYFFNQSLEGVNLPDSLQSLTFGLDFDLQRAELLPQLQVRVEQLQELLGTPEAVGTLRQQTEFLSKRLQRLEDLAGDASNRLLASMSLLSSQIDVAVAEALQLEAIEAEQEKEANTQGCLNSDAKKLIKSANLASQCRRPRKPWHMRCSPSQVERLHDQLVALDAVAMRAKDMEEQLGHLEMRDGDG